MEGNGQKECTGCKHGLCCTVSPIKTEPQSWTIPVETSYINIKYRNAIKSYYFLISGPINQHSSPPLCQCCFTVVPDTFQNGLLHRTTLNARGRWVHSRLMVNCDTITLNLRKLSQLFCPRCCRLRRIKKLRN